MQRYPDLLFIHVMKTAGTSLRGMLIDGLGAAAVYPNDDDLGVLPKGWYPGPASLVEDVREGRYHGARLIVGHIPYVLADALPRRPLTVTLLREPIARAVSMMDHRRTHSKRYRDASYADLLADDAFVSGQIRDYQTKVFAFDSLDECADDVNHPLGIDDARFGRALERLAAVDVLGVVEDVPAFTRRLQRVTAIRPGPERRSNRARGGRPPLEAATRAQLEALTVRDAVLYRHALDLIEGRAQGRGGLRGMRSRLRTRLGRIGR